MKTLRRTEDVTDIDIHMTEVLNRNDPRRHSMEMNDAKRKEIRNLLERRTFKIILKEEIAPNDIILLCRFVLTIKLTADEMVKF